MIRPEAPLIVVVGPTASGKTELAIGLAKRFNGEIVCADSRTIYRGMDIGTAKPTLVERQAVPHHLIDVVNPDQTLSVAEFKELAAAAIADIWERGKLPFLVGGSGLYIDSVVFDYQFPSLAPPELRGRLEGLTTAELLDELKRVDPEALERVDIGNRRRVIRAIEVAGQTRSKLSQPRPNTLMIGLVMNKKVIQQRIEERIKKMLEKGFFDEVVEVGEHYGWDCEALTAVGYRAFRDAALGQKTIQQAAADFASGDLRLAKKQLTWFRRNPHIIWLQDANEARVQVENFLRERESAK